jgi:hypothetical protein
MSTAPEGAVGTEGSHRVGDHIVPRFGAAAAGRVGGAAGWRAAYAPPLVLTAIIVVLARGFDPKIAPGTAGTSTAPEAAADSATA